MRRIRFTMVIMAVFLCLILKTNNVQGADSVNKDASEEVQQVLDYLESISGDKMIAGQHDKPSYPTETYNRVYELTGCYPGIWGCDFGFMDGPNDTIYNREELVSQSIEKWNQGTIPAWTWHMVRPDKIEPNTWNESVLCYSLSDYEFQQITTPGTSYYECFINRIDSVVWAFQALEDAGVPVLWRPFHEMNANWFWWGGNATYSPKLFQIMYERYTNYWGLDNIIWVWNVDRPGNGAIEQYYPGDEYVDVLSMDIYNNDYNYSYYQQMLNLANGKPIALGEVGEIPSVSILWEQPKWVWFMCWTEYLEGYNSQSHVQEIYWQDKVITRGEIVLNGSSGDESLDDDNSDILSGENLAYQKQVEVSSAESSEYDGANAVDADGITRWSSSFADYQYILVDLGEMKEISAVKVAWEAAYADQYQIQVSSNYDDWTTVYEDYNADGGTDTIRLSDVSGRYVKVYCINRATQYGFSIYELEVYGKGESESESESESVIESESESETQPSEEEASTESSEESSAESEESSEPALVTPSKVIGVQAVYEDGQIKVTWDDNGAAQYRVMRFTSETGYTTMTYKATSGGYTDTNLIEAQLYYYRICGYFYDADGNLVQGNISDSVAVVATDKDPAQVTNVTATISDGTVTLNWDAADGVRYYKIARAYGWTTADGSYTCLKYNVSDTAYADTPSYKGKWRYKVVGYYKDTDGSWVYGAMSSTLFLTVE